jgi:hypothetical protein
MLLTKSLQSGIIGGLGEKLFEGPRDLKRSEMAKLIYDFMLENDKPDIRNYGQLMKKTFGLSGDISSTQETSSTQTTT